MPARALGMLTWDDRVKIGRKGEMGIELQFNMQFLLSRGSRYDVFDMAGINIFYTMFIYNLFLSFFPIFLYAYLFFLTITYISQTSTFFHLQFFGCQFLCGCSMDADIRYITA